jgi:hypothetical protein
MVARSVKNWPALKLKLLRNASGTCKVMATAPAASGVMLETGRS